MPRLSRLAVPGYAVCLWLMLFPLLDALALAIPPAPTQVEWRYSLTELLSRSLMTPMLGTFGILILSSTFEHDGMRRFIGWASWAGSAVVVGLLAMFMVDSMGLRAGVREGLFPVFSGPWFGASAKLSLALVILVLVARGARGPIPAEAGATEERKAGQGTDPSRVVWRSDP